MATRSSSSGKEVDEQLIFQLAAATGCDLSGTSTCTAILHDAKGSLTCTLPPAYGIENTAAQNAMLAVVGNWPISVSGPNAEALVGTAKILKTGRVTVTGKLANGKTSYSLSGVLEIRRDDDVLIPSIRLVGVTKYGCLWCNEEMLK